MATSDPSDLKTRFKAFANGASLEILVPRSVDVDVARLLQDKSPAELTRAPSRRNLFFDETTPLTLVLRTSASEALVRELLPSLEVTTSAYVTDAISQGTGNSASAPAKHDLASTTFSATAAHDYINVDGHTYIVWKTNLHLARPRARLHRPGAYFNATLNPTSAAWTQAQRSKPNFVKSYEPQPRNVLEALHYDPVLQSSHVQLPETSITKIAPSGSATREELKPIRGGSKRAIPMLSALFTRIRYSALADGIVASLHIETSPVGPQNVTLTKVHLDVPDAEIDDLSRVRLPRETSAGDEVVILQKLRRLGDNTGSEKSIVTVHIEAHVSAEDGAEIPLLVTWQAQVNLSHTTPTPIYRWSRSAAVSLQPPSRTTLQTAAPRLSGDTDQRDDPHEGRVIFNFTAAPKVRRDQNVQLHVQCINQSKRARHFALVHMQARRDLSKARQASGFAQELSGTDAFATPEHRKALDVLDLNPDYQIGPLAAGASFESSMHFTPLKGGVLDLGDIKIVDLNTRQTVDVRQLPHIIAMDTELL